MELANLRRGVGDTAVIRTATQEDAADIYQLLRRATYSHIHVGWHLPIHWLGCAEFLVYEPPARGNSIIDRFWAEDMALRACLVATANPAPIAWVHVAAVRGVAEPVAVLATMLARIEAMLAKTAVTQLAWMPVDNWPDKWLLELGFTETNQVQTYLKRDMNLPALNPVADLTVRPATQADLPHLAQIEAETFAPLWRHSLEDLSAALTQAFSFDVAVLKNRIVGFQLSTHNDNMAHLARMTISPAAQKQGIGSALLTQAIQGYKQQHIQSVSLNTQTDNVASQQLYKKFGFMARNQRFSIWAKTLE